MTFLAHLADRVTNRPLMIMPAKLAIIASVLDGRIGIDSTGLTAKAGAMPANAKSQSSTKASPYFTRRGQGVAVARARHLADPRAADRRAVLEVTTTIAS